VAYGLFGFAVSAGPVRSPASGDGVVGAVLGHLPSSSYQAYRPGWACHFGLLHGRCRLYHYVRGRLQALAVAVL